MGPGVYDAILQDRDLPAAIETTAWLGLQGLELNSGGFPPAAYSPTFDDILESDPVRDELDGTGVVIAGLNCNGNPLHPNPLDRRCPHRRHPPLDPTRGDSGIRAS